MASGSFHISANYNSLASADCSWSSQHYFGNLCLITITLTCRTHDGSFNYSGVGSITVSNTESSPSVSGSITHTGGATSTVCVGSFAIPYDEYGKATASISANIAMTATHNRITSQVYDVVGSGSSGSISVGSINKYATITSAPNFGDEDNPTVKVSNPWGATNLQVCISIDGSKADIPYQAVSGGQTTFNLTDEQRQLLINSVVSGSSMPIKFRLRSYLGSTSSTHTVEKIFSLTEYEPVLNPVVVDMNSITNALTGDVSVLVRGHSQAAAQANPTPRKNAKIVSASITNGSITEPRAMADFVNVVSPTFIFTATDSRGNTGTREVKVPMVEYFEPTCEQSVKIQLSGETVARVELTMSGQFFNDSFGAIDNSITLAFRHTDNDGRMGDWMEIAPERLPEFKDNKYTFTQTIDGFDYRRTHTFECRVIDKLTTTYAEPYRAKLMPVFDWSEDDFNVNVNFNMNGETVLRHNASANNTVLSGSGGFIYLRPGGTNSSGAEVKITPQGNIDLAGDIIIDGQSLKSILRNAGLL